MDARSRLRRAAAAVVAAAACAGTIDARAGDPNVVQGTDPQAPAMVYARFDERACQAELTRRGIPFTIVAEARGVLAPIRLDGPLHGVTVRSALPARLRATSPLEILDCRLALALDDFAAILARYDVVELVHLSAYRPPSRRRWKPGRIGARHEGGLALDAATFVRRDGSELRIERDFHGRVGARTCGPGASPAPATPDAITLRKIVCEAADGHLFHVELTPDYNRQHRNHLHLEVTAQVTWFLVH